MNKLRRLAGTILVLLLHRQVFGNSIAFPQNCPPEGDATALTQADPALNRLKNRMPVGVFETLHFDDLVQLEIPDGVSKKHRDKWPDQARSVVESHEARAVSVIGYLLAVKLEGPESCNCHSENQSERDFHLWLANSSDADKSDAVVVEISPRIRSLRLNWSPANLRRFAKNGTQVRISGWLMLDPEHPEQIGKTRATLWEIHPILKIEVFSGSRWRDF